MIAAAIFGGIDIEGNGVNIDKNRLGTDIVDGTGCCDKTKRRGNDLVACADAGSHQRENEGVGAGGAADGKARSELGGDFVFKLLHFWTENEILRFEDACYRGKNFFANGGELRAKVEEIKCDGAALLWQRVWDHP